MPMNMLHQHLSKHDMGIEPGENSGGMLTTLKDYHSITAGHDQVIGRYALMYICTSQSEDRTWKVLYR